MTRSPDWLPDSPQATGGLGRCGIVAHDAGAANHIAAWSRSMPRVEIAYLEGPAARSPRLSGYPRASSLEALLSSVDWLLVGTSWPAELERDAMRSAAAAGIPVAAVLEHWINYPPRLDRSSGAWPTALVVSDPVAFALAEESFPGCPIQLWPNTLADDLCTEIQAAIADAASTPAAGSAQGDRRVLFIGEAVNWNADDERGEPEGEAILLLPEVLKELGYEPDDCIVRIRRHPKESPAKYTSSLTDAGLRPDPSATTGSTLAQDLAWADVTLGLRSYALFLARRCGRESYSLASWVQFEDRLPQDAVPLAPVARAQRLQAP